jgi:hypothetical protein
VRWVVAGLSANELRDLIYLGDPVWTDLAGRSRKAGDAAARIASPGLLILRTKGAMENVGHIQAIAERLRKGLTPSDLDPLIVVAKSENEQHVVLEGCKRLTAMLLMPELLPAELRVLVGYSSRMDEWYWYHDRIPKS